MKYIIKYRYTTGDSVSSNEYIDQLENRWENIEIVEENIKRITQHYTYYICDFGYRSLLNETVDKPNFWNDKLPFSVPLLLDNGNEWKINCPWCGNFESLQEIWVEIDLSYLKITF